MGAEVMKFYTVGLVASLAFIYWTVTECLRIKHSCEDIEDLKERVSELEGNKEDHL